MSVRTRVFLPSAISLCLFAGAVHAAQSGSQKTHFIQPQSTITDIHLGDSVVALNGPWKFGIGDSPVDPATGKALWAEPGFNDSAWENVDLTGAEGAIDPIAGTTGYLPGWTAKGHPGYWGYAWYRIRVRIETPPSVKLALAGPSDVDDIYQVFDNGKMVGEFGDFSGPTPSIFTTRPEMFLLPANNASGDSDHVLSFRVYMEPYTLSQLDDVGGFHNPPLIGEQSAVAAQNQVKWDELYRSYAGNLVETVLFTLLGLIAFSLMLFDRDDPVYLWIGALLSVTAVSACINLLSTWTEWVPYIVTAPIRLTVLTPLIYVGWVMVWRVWFRLRRPAWVPWAVLGLFLLLMITSSIGQNLFFVLVPTRVENAFHVASLVVRLMIAAMLLWTVFQGILEQGLEGWIAVPPVLLASVAEFSAELNFFHIVPTWFPFGFQFSTRQLANLLLVAALALLLLRRLTKSIRLQRQMALDVKQAQELQQVILPEQRAVMHGYEIESEYRPALEVGGDFFQIVPIAADGSLLIVAGDVAGKGLKAGMLVALLVGAIRTAAQFDPDPMTVLRALNQRLRGRGEAFATCLALRISAEGDVILANAGHPTPYLNGKPIEIEGSLPLGMLESPEFTLRRFRLSPRDRLMMLSDGVAEAQDASGQLLGFDRVNILLRGSKSAAEIANAAQTFGQQDDISVIAVTRIAVPEPTSA